VTLDADGRVLSISVTESRFTPRDVAVLLASRRAERAPRGSHGMLLSETTDPANTYAYKAALPTTDFAAKALADAQKAYRTEFPDAQLESLLWRVEKH
jgi:hypothetical protein